LCSRWATAPTRPTTTRSRPTRAPPWLHRFGRQSGHAVDGVVAFFVWFTCCQESDCANVTAYQVPVKFHFKVWQAPLTDTRGGGEGSSGISRGYIEPQIVPMAYLMYFGPPIFGSPRPFVRSVSHCCVAVSARFRTEPFFKPTPTRD